MASSVFVETVPYWKRVALVSQRSLAGSRSASCSNTVSWATGNDVPVRRTTLFVYAQIGANHVFAKRLGVVASQITGHAP